MHKHGRTTGVTHTLENGLEWPAMPLVQSGFFKSDKVL